MVFAVVYTIILFVVSLITLIFSIQGFKRKKLLGTLLGVISIIIIISSYSYILSVLSKNHTVVNIFANLYFGTISIILALYIVINTLFCKIKVNKFWIVKISVRTSVNVEEISENLIRSLLAMLSMNLLKQNIE